MGIVFTTPFACMARDACTREVFFFGFFTGYPTTSAVSVFCSSAGKIALTGSTLAASTSPLTTEHSCYSVNLLSLAEGAS
jgi:hypothetical protein